MPASPQLGRASLRRCPDLSRSQLSSLDYQLSGSGPKRPQAAHPYGLCWAKPTPQSAPIIFPSVFARRKKFIRSQAVPGGLMRTEAVRPVPFRAPHPALRISHGPITRQYAAISGNKRTKVQFLAAYCRLSVRILPRNLRLVRICSLGAGLGPGAGPEGPSRLASSDSIVKEPASRRYTPRAFTAHGLPLAAHYSMGHPPAQPSPTLKTLSQIPMLSNHQTQILHSCIMITLNLTI